MQKANFDLDQLEPIRHCGSSFVPGANGNMREMYWGYEET